MSPTLRTAVGTVLVTGAFAGCSSVEITAPPLQVIEEIEFHPDLAVDLARMTEHESGMYYEDLAVGEGLTAETGDEVVVHFTGFIATTANRFFEDPQAQIRLGVGEIPAGLDLAIQGMKVGGSRRAVVPPELGYGRVPRSGVPGGSVLVYDVELMQVFKAGEASAAPSSRGQG